MIENEYITLEVLEFVPPDIAIKSGEGYTQQRHIFGTLDLDDFEKQHIGLLRLYLQENFYDIADTILDDDYTLLRFHQGNQFDPERTIEDLKHHIEWRSLNLPPDPSLIDHLFDRGIMYIHGRDKCMRPILIMRSKQLGEVTEDFALKLTYYWLEFMLANLLLPNVVEQWRVLVDLEGTGYTDFPITILKSVASHLQHNYRARLGGMLIVRMPYIFYGAWKMVEYLLQESTKKKIRITADNFQETLLQVIHPHQLESRFGGAQPDVQTFSHKPIMPPAPYRYPNGIDPFVNCDNDIVHGGKDLVSANQKNKGWFW
eukprot:Platyproteum_vivax@DN1662_c0_g1_i1.p1